MFVSKLFYISTRALKEYKIVLLSKVILDDEKIYDSVGAYKVFIIANKSLSLYS